MVNKSLQKCLVFLKLRYAVLRLRGISIKDQLLGGGQFPRVNPLLILVERWLARRGAFAPSHLDRRARKPEWGYERHPHSHPTSLPDSALRHRLDR